MNNKRREELKQSYDLIVDAWRLISAALKEEQDSFDRFPAKLRSNSRYLAMENAIEQLNAALDHLDGAVTCIKEVTG